MPYKIVMLIRSRRPAEAKRRGSMVAQKRFILISGIKGLVLSSWEKLLHKSVFGKNV
jgi:hypothetical protein